MLISFVALSAFTVAMCYGPLSVQSGNSPFEHDDSANEGSRFRREISEECRPPLPPPPPHLHQQHHHPHHSEEMGTMLAVCCPIPSFVPILPEAWGKCQEIVYPQQKQKRELHLRVDKYEKRISGDDSDHGPPTPPPPEFFQEKRECFLDCAFNASGYMSNDGTLTEEIMSQKLIEGFANDGKWASITDPVYKKCVAAAKEINSQSQKTCKPGAAEYMKCMTRELFFKCPSDLWVNSSECIEYKKKLEKCPNLSPA